MTTRSANASEYIWWRYRFVLVPLLGYVCVLIGLSALTYAFDINAILHGSIHPLSPALRCSFRGAVITLACWLACGDGSWVYRCVVGFSVLVWIWIVNQVCLNSSAHGNISSAFGYHQLLEAPFNLFAAILLLTVARLVGHLRLARSDASQPIPDLPRQFTLVQGLLCVAGVGLTFGAIRLVAQPGPTHILMFTWLKSPEFYQTGIQSRMLETIFEILIVVPTAIVLVYYTRWWPLAVAYFLGMSLAASIGEPMPWIGLRSFQFYRIEFGVQRIEKAAVTLIPVLLLFLAMRSAGYHATWRTFRKTER